MTWMDARVYGRFLQPESFAAQSNCFCQTARMWHGMWIAACILACSWIVWFVVDLTKKRGEIDGLVNASLSLSALTDSKLASVKVTSISSADTFDPASTTYAEQALWPPLHRTGIKETFPAGVSWPSICRVHTDQIFTAVCLLCGLVSFHKEAIQHGCHSLPFSLTVWNQKQAASGPLNPFHC
jgi:hypothetical protein